VFLTELLAERMPGVFSKPSPTTFIQHLHGSVEGLFEVRALCCWWTQRCFGS
jgi:hypothetical protein